MRPYWPKQANLKKKKKKKKKKKLDASAILSFEIVVIALKGTRDNENVSIF